MKIFGVSLFTLAIVFLAFWVGTKNPGALSGVPIVGTL